MDTHEVERIRSLWETYMRGSQWLEKPEALQALGAEVGLLLAIIDAQQAVVVAAGDAYADAEAEAERIEHCDFLSALPSWKALGDALAGLKGEGDARADGAGVLQFANPL